MEETKTEITEKDLEKAVMIWFEVNNHILRVIRGHHNMLHPIYFIRRRMLRMLHRLLSGYINDAIDRSTELNIKLPELKRPEKGIDKIKT